MNAALASTWSDISALRFQDFYADNVELIGLITGIFSVLLLVFTRFPRLQWFAWPAGVINAIVYLYLFYEWGLYGNFILQPFFLVISLQGLWAWRGQLRGVIADVPEIPTTFNPWLAVLSWIVAVALLLVVYPLLAYFDDPSPLWDGLILTFSLAAIFLQLRKHVESWFFWIVVDLIAVPFHWVNDHPATATLYFVYLLMCFVGLTTWAMAAVQRENQYQNGIEIASPA